jgi:large subunit ribosomal protein L4
MPNINVYKMDGSVAGEIELSEKVFGAEYKEALIHQAIVTRLANERQGTKGTLTRSEVRGGGKKPWRQKGTGNARQGSIRAPQWIKGGIVFAPKSRDFSMKINAEAKIEALFSALSKKLADGELLVLEDFAVTAAKTKEVAAFLKTMNLDKRTLIVMDKDDNNAILASRNIKSVCTLPVAQINTYDVVSNAKVVLTKGAVEKIEEVYGE